MLLVAPVSEERRVSLPPEELQQMKSDPDLRRRVNVARSQIPAVTHVDYSARVQTVDKGRNPRLSRLLGAFAEKTGCPVLVNTSFNVRGEPSSALPVMPIIASWGRRWMHSSWKTPSCSRRTFRLN